MWSVTTLQISYLSKERMFLKCLNPNPQSSVFVWFLHYCLLKWFVIIFLCSLHHQCTIYIDYLVNEQIPLVSYYKFKVVPSTYLFGAFVDPLLVVLFFVLVTVPGTLFICGLSCFPLPFYTITSVSVFAYLSIQFKPKIRFTLFCVNVLKFVSLF